MNMEAYNLDYLRRLVRSLQDENKRLKQQLDKAKIPYETENVFVEKIEDTQEYDPDQGGYFPQCNNRWDNRLCPKQRGEKQSCEVCAHREWTKLTPEKLMNHLLGMKEDGSDVLGGISSSCWILTRHYNGLPIMSNIADKENGMAFTFLDSNDHVGRLQICRCKG